MSEGPPRIRALPDRVINQIAAGEVVERPASVVKELLDNSLDAGASQLRLVIEGGGEQLIRVLDNGRGIDAEDLPLAVQRHCTSKIREAEDLRGIESLGFRGEALPSIAAVSRLTLRSRTEAADLAQQLRVDGGEMLGKPLATAHPVGTTVEVRDLFFNTPARRRFLRSARTELFHIQQLTRRVAASRMGVAIELEYGKRTSFRVAAAQDGPSLQRRLTKLCGAAFVKHALPLDARAGDLVLHGWVGDARTATRHPDIQFLALGGRAIRDPTVNRALRRAFDEFLQRDLQPQYLLNLELDPTQFDVNVHPTKLEVRFREPRGVHDFIFSAVRAVLSRGRQIPVAEIAATSSYTSTHTVVPPHVREPGPGTANRYSGGRTAGTLPDADEHPHVLAQIGTGYVLTRNGQGAVALVDIVALRAAILRQGLMNGHRAGTLEQRPLLVPEALSVAATDAQLLEDATAELQGCGIDIGSGGPDLVMLRGVPALLRDAIDAQGLIAALLAVLRNDPGDAQALLAAVASAAAILPAGLSEMELAAVLRRCELGLAQHDIDPGRFRAALDVAAAAALLATSGRHSE